MIEKLHRHLDVRWLAGDDHQPLAFLAGRCGGAIHTHPNSARFHNLYLTCTHVSNLIDLAAALANDASHEIIGDVDLLRLQLLWGVVGAVSRARIVRTWRRV